VGWLRQHFGASERRACRLLGQPRATQRQRPAAQEGEARLVARMRELVGRHPRYGYRRVWALLRAAGWRVNRKRVYRLWRRQGLNVPRQQRKKRRLGHSGNGCTRRRAESKDQVWAWDFIHDRTSDGRPPKWLSVVDEYTRECLALEVGRSMTAAAAVAVPGRLAAERGAPGHIRSDNGPEFIARAIRRWLERAGVSALSIAPGAPWENGFAESLHGKLRDELLEREEFASLLEARVLARQWRHEYNHVRPHSALGYRTPAMFAGDAKRTVGSTLTAPGT
jgi:putative transposase